MIAEIPRYQESRLLSPREKAAINYAEIPAGDHRAASPELFEELSRFFTEAEIIDLGWRIVRFVGYGRLIHEFKVLVWGIGPNMRRLISGWSLHAWLAATSTWHRHRLSAQNELCAATAEVSP
jgi:hypothetical protein